MVSAIRVTTERAIARTARGRAVVPIVLEIIAWAETLEEVRETLA
jgi:hypothetical protein